MKNNRYITILNPQTGDEKRIKNGLNFLLFFAPFLFAIPYFKYKIPYFKIRRFIILLPSIYLTVMGLLVFVHLLSLPFPDMEPLMIYTRGLIVINIILFMYATTFGLTMMPDESLPLAILIKAAPLGMLALFIYTAYLSIYMLIMGNEIIKNHYRDNSFHINDADKY